MDSHMKKENNVKRGNQKIYCMISLPFRLMLTPLSGVVGSALIHSLEVDTDLLSKCPASYSSDLNSYFILLSL